MQPAQQLRHLLRIVPVDAAASGSGSCCRAIQAVQRVRWVLVVVLLRGLLVVAVVVCRLLLLLLLRRRPLRHRGFVVMRRCLVGGAQGLARRVAVWQRRRWQQLPFGCGPSGVLQCRVWTCSRRVSGSSR